MVNSILTLRYDLTQKPILPKINSHNFHNEIPSMTHIENIIEKSLKKIKNKPTNIAIALSGGVDSTLTLYFLRKFFPDSKIEAISIKFSDSTDESKIAAKIAEHFDINQHVISIDNYLEELPKAISIVKIPFWDLHWYYVAKKAQTLTKHLATGDGGDELFGGYVFRYRKFLNLLNKNDNWKIRTINYLECHNRDWVPDQERMFGSSIKFDWNIIYDYFRPFFQNKLSPLKQAMLADFNGKLLHDFIPMGRSIAEYYNIHSFPIFLDPDVISFALRLPIKQKYDQKSYKGKLILREIASKLGVKHIDEKRGFSPSLFTDWKDHGREICTKYLLDENSNIYRKKLININWVRRAFHTVDDDGDIRYLNRLISILALEIWYRVIITKEIKPRNKL